MSLNVDRVWLRTAQGEVLVPVSQVQPGDAVVVRAGGIIPVDGLVLEGEVTVNQASLTGESIPVPKRPGGAVYAGTVWRRANVCWRSNRPPARAAMTRSST